MDHTNWDAYGRASGNPKCADCMVHCGYEPAAVEASLGSLRGMLQTAWLMAFGVRTTEAPAEKAASPGPMAKPQPLLPILE